jgi:hypothetical protein
LFKVNVLKRQVQYFLKGSLLSLLVLLSACTTVYKGTGSVMIGYAEDHGVPYILAIDDVTLGCSMVEAFSPFLLSFSQVTTSPDQLAVLFYLMAGNCTEFKAWDEELRYLRAVHAKNSIEAQDARIAQQRLLGLAAQRQLTGYHYLASAFVEPGAECPTFVSENDELYWLLGLLNGIQAIINDIASAGTVEVPMGIAAKVGRGAACLDNEKWWGTPAAIQAGIWIAIPANKPVDKDPVQVLQDSMQLGLRQGIRIPQVLATQVFLGQGNIEMVKKIIRNYTGLIKQTTASQTYKILNQISDIQIQAISDRLWTEATGMRTPLGRIGSFWDDPEKIVDTIEIDEIL